MSDHDPQLCLVGKVLSDHRNLGKTGVISIVKGAWRTREPFTVHPWDHNHFLFIFKNKNDLQKVMDESPWSVMGYYLALAPWNPDQTLGEINFNRGKFWVQAHGLPFGKMTKDYAIELASKVGTLVELDCVGEGLQLNRPFLRFRVEIDLSAPLCPGFELPRDGLKPLFVSFRYERLSNFCYACGRLGHDEETCSYPKDPRFSRKLIDSMRANSAKRISLPSNTPIRVGSGTTPTQKLGVNMAEEVNIRGSSPLRSAPTIQASSSCRSDIPNNQTVNVNTCVEQYVTKPLLSYTFCQPNPSSTSTNIPPTYQSPFPVFNASIASDESQKSSLRWIPPINNRVKLNCDASFIPNRASSGIIVRDSTGAIILCSGETFPASDPLMAELLAIRSACCLAITYGWHNATIESDSKIAISLASSTVEPPWALAAIVVDIKAWASQFAISFSWAKRECNLAAHCVAKIAFRSLDNFVWDVNFPDEITSAARSDVI